MRIARSSARVDDEAGDPVRVTEHRGRPATLYRKAR